MVTQNTEHNPGGNVKNMLLDFWSYFCAGNPEMDGIFIDTQILVKSAQILVKFTQILVNKIK
jgi:hypothetical protein